MQPLAALLASKRVLILDSAMGTELQRHGIDISLPLWSAHALISAPHVVRNIHFFSLHAGADVITTNTFRTNLRTLKRAGMESRYEELNIKAVEFAFEARDRYRPMRPVLVAASIAPVEDCYAPALVPSDEELREEHGMQAEQLALAGADLFLVETMNTIREARIAAQACIATGRETAVSLVCRADGALLSGESLEEAVAAVSTLGVSALLVNCVSARVMHVPLGILLRCSPVPAGCYANVGEPTADGTAVRHDISDDAYVDAAADWQAAGARIIGGCCGTTPALLASIVSRIAPLPPDIPQRLW